MTDRPLDFTPPDGTKLVIVPKYKQACRVCGWSKENPSLYNWVSTLALKGNGYSYIHTSMKEYIILNHLDIFPPSKKSIWNHFKRHIQPIEAVEISVARRGRGVAKSIDPLIDQKVLEEIKAGNFDEYKELCSLYIKFREVHDKIYQLADSLIVNRSSDTADWSQTKIQTYVSMVNTQKSILAEIGKMRQGDKLVVMVANYIVEIFAKSIVNRLSDEFASLGSIMKRQGVDPTVLQAFENVTHDRLARLIVDEAETAMSVTKKEFKLPN